MPRTVFSSREIGSVQKNDIDISTIGQSLVTNIVAGNGISISQTGADIGTGAVTITANVTSAITSLGKSGSQQTGASQILAVGTTGNDFSVTSDSNIHTFNLPDASASARGVINTSTQTFAGNKTFTGTLTLTGVAEGVGTKTLRYNPSSGLVTYHDIPSGGGAGVGVTDGDKGDIVVSNIGTTWMIDTSVRANWDTAFGWGNHAEAGYVTTSGVTGMGVAGSIQTGATQTFAVGTTGTNFNITSSGNTHTFNIPNATTANRGLVTTADQTFAGNKTFESISSGIVSLTGSTRLYTSAYAENQTWLGTSTLTDSKVYINTPLSSYTLTANSNIVSSSFLSAFNAITTASTGTHPFVSNMGIKALTVNAGTATVTNASTLYIEGAAIGTATITNNYALWVDAGTTRLDGQLELQGISSATSTNVLYFDATTKRVSYGVAASGGGLTWNNVTTTTQALAVSNGYIANNASLVTMTLPTTAAIGSVINIAGAGAGGWRISQNAGQSVKFGTISTTTGTGGYLSSTNQYDAIELLCIVANTTWVVINSQGNINYV